LVLAPSAIVNTVHVSPVNISRKIRRVNDIPRHRLIYEFAFRSEVGPLISLASRTLLQEIASVKIIGLVSVGNIVSRVILFILSSVMYPRFSPGVSSSGPSAISFNGNVVDASHNSEETFFSPVSTP